MKARGTRPLRNFCAIVLAIVLLVVSVPGAQASTYWYSGQRTEGSWYVTHPHTHTYSYISVDVSCGWPCQRWLNSPTSGYLQTNAEIHHWGSGTGVLSCMWDTTGSGTSKQLDCYRS